MKRLRIYHILRTGILFCSILYIEVSWTLSFGKLLYDIANIEMTPTPQTNESDCGKFLCGTHATPHQKL